MFNNDFERKKANVKEETISFWTVIQHNYKLFFNPNYVASEEVLYPSYAPSDIVLWTDYYFRFSHQGSNAGIGLENFAPDLNFPPTIIQSPIDEEDSEEDKELETWKRLDRNGFLVEPGVLQRESAEQFNLEHERAMKWHRMMQDWETTQKNLKKVNMTWYFINL